MKTYTVDMDQFCTPILFKGVDWNDAIRRYKLDQITKKVDEYKSKLMTKEFGANWREKV